MLSSDAPDDQSAVPDTEESTASLKADAENLLERLAVLLDEVESFRRSLREKEVENFVELRHFSSQIKSEHRCIQAAAQKASSSPEALHVVRSTNLPYLEAVWQAAKSTTGVIALHKTFSIPNGGETAIARDESGKKAKLTANVDIVAQNGLQWIKVSTVSARRLLYEIAEAGWEEGSSDEDSDEDSDQPSGNGTVTLATSTLAVIALASALIRAAAATRVKYQHPVVHYHFTNLSPGPDTPEVNEVLSRLSDMGVQITCGSFGDSPPREISDMVQGIACPLRRHGKPPTDTLNIDTTVLIALASDICNTVDTPIQDRFHHAVVKQIKEEKMLSTLTAHLLPVIRGRQLVCGSTARRRFEEIVDSIATEAERRRAELLMAPPTLLHRTDGVVQEELSPEERLRRLQELCAYPLPQDLRLPIRTIDEQSIPPPPASASVVTEDSPTYQKVSSQLSPVNRGVFLSAWRHGWTTISSNATVAKTIESAVEDGVPGEGEVVGPDIYVVPVARSLVGKAKKKVPDAGAGDV